MVDKELLNELVDEAMERESITCPECGSVLEVDCKECTCGWENLLVWMGVV